jgi:hypothetical protein
MSPSMNGFSAEYDVLAALKLRAANLKRPTKKSELLRAGIVTLQEMADKARCSDVFRVSRPVVPSPKSEAASLSRSDLATFDAYPRRRHGGVITEA